MNLVETIILSGSFLTALGVIIATAVKLYRFVRKWEKWADDQSEHSLDNYMSIMQLKIMSPYMPLSERIKAGDKYVSLGGNGEVKHKYHQLIKELEKQESQNLRV